MAADQLPPWHVEIEVNYIDGQWVSMYVIHNDDGNNADNLERVSSAVFRSQEELLARLQGVTEAIKDLSQ